MEQQEQILYYQQNAVDEKYVQINLANGGKRFGYYIIDYIVVIILYFAICFSTGFSLVQQVGCLRNRQMVYSFI